MSLDFVLKDIYRSRRVTFPLLYIMSLMLALTTFIVNLFNSISRQTFVSMLNNNFASFENPYYLSGAIDHVFSQFNNLFFVIILILNFIIVVTSSVSLILSKKEDISSMKALGCIPQKLYSYYLLEALVLFTFSFLIGYILGVISFLSFSLYINLLGFPLVPQVNFFIHLIIFFFDLLGVYFITGAILRKVGQKSIIKLFSKDIPYNLVLSKPKRFIKSRYFALKIAINNLKRRRRDYRRYTIIFSTIILIIFTLSTGNLMLNHYTRDWIHKSQNDNIIVVGHKNVINNYSKMYEMFSNPNICVTKEDKQFTNPNFLFNISDLSGIENYNAIEKIDYRLIDFCDVEELNGYYNNYDSTKDSGPYPPPPSGYYSIIGQQRKGCFPFMGIDSEQLIQDFEIQGRFFNENDAFDNITIGDGLAYNFFDYAYAQSIRFTNLHHSFHISGILIDSFYSGHAGYLDRSTFQEMCNLTGDQINIACLKTSKDQFNQSFLSNFIKENLGESFSFISLNNVFEKNLDFLASLNSYSIFTLIVLYIIAIILIYIYQKSSLSQKLTDYAIMRAIGAKFKTIKNILFWEFFLILVISIAVSFALGLILTILFSYNLLSTPPIQFPIMMILIIFFILTSSSYMQIQLLKTNFKNEKIVQLL